MWNTMECKRDSFSGVLGGARETRWECVSHRLNFAVEVFSVLPEKDQRTQVFLFIILYLGSAKNPINIALFFFVFSSIHRLQRNKGKSFRDVINGSCRKVTWMSRISTARTADTLSRRADTWNNEATVLAVWLLPNELHWNEAKKRTKSIE